MEFFLCISSLNYLFLTHIHAFVIFYDNGKLNAKCSRGRERENGARESCNNNKKGERYGRRRWNEYVQNYTMRKSTFQFVC